MKTKQLSVQLNNQVAMSREGSGYAINWSPCGFTSYEHKDRHEAFEGWDE
jgi:hypothetical protein